jgi:hypothetical protein
MKDLIDRQAAIDASCTCHGGVHCNHYPCKDVQAIMDLPPAQPEIIHCKDCKYYSVGHDGLMYCWKHDDDILWHDDDFCSYAERRKGVKNEGEGNNKI